MTAVASVMADPVYCTYVSVKVDVDLMTNLKVAAARKGKPLQEYLSDLINDLVARDALAKPVKRKPPKPRRGPRARGG